MWEAQINPEFVVCSARTISLSNQPAAHPNDILFTTAPSFSGTVLYYFFLVEPITHIRRVPWQGLFVQETVQCMYGSYHVPIPQLLQ